MTSYDLTPLLRSSVGFDVFDNIFDSVFNLNESSTSYPPYNIIKSKNNYTITMAIAGFIYVVWKMKMAGLFIYAMAPIGASFTILALISGAIWGQPTWGTWWIWDARLTSTLVLLLFYLVIIGLYSSFDNKKSADQAVSILTMVGAINLPIIKKSVDWWNTLHQPATIKVFSESSIANEMLYPLLICIFSFYILVFLFGLMAMRAEIAKRELNKSWFKNLILGND